MHKTVFALGATVLGKLGRLGHKLKQHHVHAREEGMHILQLPTSARLQLTAMSPGVTECPCALNICRRAAKGSKAGKAETSERAC